MQIAKSVLIIVLASIMISSCSRCAPPSTKNPEKVLENVFDKYKDMAKKGTKEYNTAMARVLIKYEYAGQIPMPIYALGGGKEAEFDMRFDSEVEVWYSRPLSFYVETSGDLGEVKLVFSGKKDPTMTIALPKLKKYAHIDFKDVLEDEFEGEYEEMLEKMENAEDALEDEIDEFLAEEADNLIDQFLESVDLEHKGMKNLRAGRSHVIGIKPDKKSIRERREKKIQELREARPRSSYDYRYYRDPYDDFAEVVNEITVYVLDRKWDVVRVDIDIESPPDEEVDISMKASFEIKDMKLNPRISDRKFDLKPRGYTEIHPGEIVMLAGMQALSRMLEANLEAAKKKKPEK